MKSVSLWLSFFACMIFPGIATQSSLAQPNTLPVVFERVCDNAAVGDGGNAWGGHQCRIVRTRYGVFTAFTREGGGYYDREWHVAHRSADGWQEIAHGTAGREPVNLLAAPDGALYVIGWPKGKARMWQLTPDSAGWKISQQAIAGQSEGYWPYNSAGIDAAGNLCVLCSEGGESPGGAFRYSYFQAAQKKWLYRKATFDFRYCYTYVFPQAPSGLSLVSTRDVRWQALGYQKPENAGDYAFNAFRYWYADSAAAPLTTKASVVEPPTSEFPNVVCNAQKDAYLDTHGHMHVLYLKVGSSTRGMVQHRHAIFSSQGEQLFDGMVPNGAGWYNRIVQDSNERFFLLGDSGLLYLLAGDGSTAVDSLRFDLQGYRVEYSGFGVSVPRTGTPLHDVMDVVFPSNNGKEWIYFSLPLADLFPGTSVAVMNHTRPAQCALGHSYPNPCNDETRISYTLGWPGDISLQVFNTAGQNIATLASGLRSPGQYEVRWDGKNDAGQSMATGVYFIRFTAAEYQAMRKVLLIR